MDVPLLGLKKKIITLLNFPCSLEHCSILKTLYQWAEGGIEFQLIKLMFSKKCFLSPWEILCLTMFGFTVFLIFSCFIVWKFAIAIGVTREWGETALIRCLVEHLRWSCDLVAAGGRIIWDQSLQPQGKSHNHSQNSFVSLLRLPTL